MSQFLRGIVSPIVDKITNPTIIGNGKSIRWQRLAQFGVFLFFTFICFWRLAAHSINIVPNNTISWGESDHNTASITHTDDAPTPTAAPIPNRPFYDRDTQNCRRSLAPIFDRFQVILKTGAIEEKDRLPKHLKSVTKCIHNLLIFSDVNSWTEDGTKIHDALSYLPQDLMVTDNPDYDYYAKQKEYVAKGEQHNLDWGRGGKLDRFKFLPMVYASWRMRPNAPWYIFIETDTYVFWDGMLRLLGKLDPNEPHYIGSPVHSSQPGENAWYAYGGSGFVISQGAMRKLFAGRGGNYPFFSHPKWILRMKKDFYGESILGSALRDAHVNLTGMYPSFFPQNFEVIPFGPAPKGLWCEPVITMHKVLYDHEYTDMDPFNIGHQKPILFETVFNSLEPHKQGSPRLLTDNVSLDPCFNTIPGLDQQNCKAACWRIPKCLQWLHHDDQCYLYETVSKGNYRVVPSSDDNERKIAKLAGNYTSGWLEEKIEKQMVNRMRCQRPSWLEPSLERHWSGS